MSSAAPIDEAYALKLAESERRIDRFDEHRNEAPGIASCGRLIADPRRLDGGSRPQDYDCVSILERGIDRIAETRASTNLEIPPDRMARARQRVRQPLGLLEVGAGIAEKDVSRGFFPDKPRRKQSGSGAEGKH